MGEYAGTLILKWWDWGWSWILSKKPIFAQDLEMNEEETKILGSSSRGSWRHVFYKCVGEEPIRVLARALSRLEEEEDPGTAHAAPLVTSSRIAISQLRLINK
ncbi:hypothetical protein UlMin_028546 [Ulmus minor]